MQVKTAVAEQWAGGTVALARLFDITHASVSQWGEFMPTARVFELRVKRPEWFDRTGNLKKPR